ncbi:MAG: hypothetical protein MZV64_18260 [Ignavibacteriales bacterium]|nr:hypothetical protein [Ignavibacteriales bacterium]
MIDIDGTISSALETGFLSREKSVVARVFERLERAARDPRVKAVILRLDTPGGEVTASDIVYHEVLRFKGAHRPARHRPDDERGRLGRLLHRLGLRPHRRPPLDPDRQHRRHLRLPQRRGADGQGRGQGRRRQIGRGQGLGLAVPRHVGRGPEDLPGHRRRILRGLPARSSPAAAGDKVPADRAADDRRRARLHGAPGPRSSGSSTPWATSTTPSKRPSRGPAWPRRQARVLHLFPEDQVQHLRRPPPATPSLTGRQGPGDAGRDPEDGLLLPLAAADGLSRADRERVGRQGATTISNCGARWMWALTVQWSTALTMANLYFSGKSGRQVPA